jgi:hypothetical protein
LVIFKSFIPQFKVDDDKLMQMIWDSLLHLFNECSLIDELGETFEQILNPESNAEIDRPNSAASAKRGRSAGPPVFRQRRQTTS